MYPHRTFSLNHAQSRQVHSLAPPHTFTMIDPSLENSVSSGSFNLIPFYRELSREPMLISGFGQHQKLVNQGPLPEKMINVATGYPAPVLLYSYTTIYRMPKTSQHKPNESKIPIDCEVYENSNHHIKTDQTANSTPVIKESYPSISIIPKPSKMPVYRESSIERDDPKACSHFTLQKNFDVDQPHGKFDQLELCLINYFSNEPMIFEKEKFDTYWENFVFAELCKFMRIMTADEAARNSFDVGQVVLRRSPKIKKKLKMFQMIYCKVVKSLYRTFELRQGEKQRAPNSLKSNRRFFAHYFGELARGDKVDLNNFNHFKCSDNANLTYFFLRNVFRSPFFRNEFLNFLDYEFITEYRNERFGKIKSMLRKWEGMLQDQSKSMEETLGLISKEINSKRFKFVLDDLTISIYLDKFKAFICNVQMHQILQNSNMVESPKTFSPITNKV